MARIVSISVGSEYDDLRKQHNLSWTAAARVGMGILLGDRNLIEYEKDTLLYKKMRAYQAQVSALTKEIEEESTRRQWKCLNGSQTTL